MTREEAIKIIDCYDIGFYDLSGEKIPADKLADAFDMAIEALQGDMYCPNCGVRLVPEDEYIEPTPTHGRLIDADALSKKLCETTIFIKDGEVFQRMINDAPTVQADRPHGEWIKHKWAEEFDGLLISNYECTNCHSWERNNTDFCPNCGADMRKGKE